MKKLSVQVKVSANHQSSVSLRRAQISIYSRAREKTQIIREAQEQRRHVDEVSTVSLLSGVRTENRHSAQEYRDDMFVTLTQ